MNEHERSFHKPERRHRGSHVEPTRLEQVEDALHRLSKKVGKLSKAQRDMKADLERELEAFKAIRAAFATELAELKKLRAAFEGDLARQSRPGERAGEGVTD